MTSRRRPRISLQQTVAKRGREAPQYVVGRIAEQLGRRDDAIEAYRKVTLSPWDSPEMATQTLARRRLAALGAK